MLIVEDEPLVAFDNEHALTQAGFQVVATVDRADAARRYLDPGQIDAALLDVTLADGASGIELARYASERGIPVLFVTGTCPGEAQPWAYGCLGKPYHPQDLVRSIDMIDAVVRGEAVQGSPPGLTLFRLEA